MREVMSAARIGSFFPFCFFVSFFSSVIEAESGIGNSDAEEDGRGLGDTVEPPAPRLEGPDPQPVSAPVSS